MHVCVFGCEHANARADSVLLQPLVFLLGNSFAGYEERSIGGRLQREAPLVHAASVLAREVALPNTFDPEVHFNDLALHSFQAHAHPEVRMFSAVWSFSS
jgi:hypothetical protein